MLSKGEKLNELKRLRTLPMLERPQTVRLKFQKVGSLQYISHLDLQRTFNRVIARACIPVWYTKGFNPHAKLVFSTPLSVGAQSRCEFLDIRIDRHMDCCEIMDRLNQELTDELRILDAYIPTHDFSEIGWASYELEFFCEGCSEELGSKIKELLTGAPFYMVKKTKSGEKEVDLIPMIRDVETRYFEETGILRLSVLLRASSTEFLNPELLISGLKQRLDILSGDPMKETYTVMRTAILKEDLTLFS